MAAMSERFTASALWPRFSGFTSGKKCVPDTIVSTETARSMPLVTSTRAQSSPTPSTALAAGRVKWRLIRSNSGELFAMGFPSLGSLFGDLFGPHRRRQLVQHAVHVLVAIGAAEALAKLDRLVDRHAVGNLRVVHQLPRADEEDRALDWAHLVPLAVDVRLDLRAQALGLADGALELRLQERLVGRPEGVQLLQVAQHHRGSRPGEDPLVDALQRELARQAARRSLHRAIAFSVFAISTATRAASAPFTAARERACSSVDVVSTPLAIGTPASSCTSRMPRALSLATTSK